MVENSTLELKRSDFFKEDNKGKIFNPCINEESKTLIYVKYTVKGYERVLIYDFQFDSLRIPHDVK